MPVGIVRAELRGDDLLQLGCLLLRPGLERTEVPGLDAVARELETRRNDPALALRVQRLAALPRGLEQPVVLEVAHEAGRRARSLAERVEVELPLGLAAPPPRSRV